MSANIHSFQPHYTKGFTLVLLSACCYGLQPFFAYFAYAEGADPIGLLLARFSLAVILMLLLMKKQKALLPAPMVFVRTLLVGIGYAGAAIGYYISSHSTSFSLAVILMFSFPALVTLFSILFLKEQSSWRKILSLLLASSGVVLAAGTDFKGDLSGIAWALFAAISYGAAILYGTHTVSHQNPLTSATAVLMGCLIAVAVAAVFQGITWPHSVNGWLAIFGLAVFGTIFPIALFISGSPHIGASNAATLSTLEPIVAIVIAVLLIGEHFDQTMLMGGVMVMVAAVMLSRKSR